MTLIHEITFPAAQLSAFGTLETAELTPVIQGDFVNGLNAQIWNAAVVSGTGAAVDTNSSRLRIQSGTNAAGYAYITTRRTIRYRAGQGTTVRFTPLFTLGVVDNLQLWGVGSIVSNAPFDGYFFGYNGDAFGIAHYISGTPTWYAQASDWNGDKVDGSAGTSFSWNPETGVPVQIKYPFLGYGDIEFFVQHPSTGAWVLVHVLRYANTTNSVQLSNPNLFWLGYTKNSGNTTNKTMFCGSLGAFVSGHRSFVSNPHWASDSLKSGISTTETSMLGLRNATNYNGSANRSLIRLNSMSCSVKSSAAQSCIVRFKINATLGGSPTYAPVNGTTVNSGVTITAGNSIASTDVAATTVTASTGSYIFNVSLGPNNSQMLDLTSLDLIVAPGETLTVSAWASGTSDVNISINWSEDI